MSMRDRNAVEETVIAAGLSLAAEAFCVGLFLFMLFVWFAVIGTKP